MYVDLGIQPRESKISTIHFELFLAMLSDVDIENFPKAVFGTISSNVLLPGRTHFKCDTKINTINPSSAPGESPGNLVITLTPQLEGISRRSLEWVYGINGERVIAFWENCNTRQRYIAGSPCSGGLLVSIQSLGRMEDGANGAVLNMVGDQCPDPLYFYDGPIIRDAPQVIPADATTFALTDKVQYRLSENTAATALASITAVDDTSVGRIIELLGAGVDYPTSVAPSASFILANGITWSALLGSKLSLQIVKTGGADYAFYEVARA